MRVSATPPCRNAVKPGTLQLTLPPLLLVRPQPLARVLDIALPPPVRARPVRGRLLRKVALAVPADKDAGAPWPRTWRRRDYGRKSRAGARARDGRVAGRRDGRAGRVELLAQARVLLLQARVLFLQSAV